METHVRQKILITGGAGFIGSHLTDELVENGYEVRVLDNLSPQIHGPDGLRPAYLHRDAELMVGDVRCAETVARALDGIDAVYHFAAMVGVGQSMYQVRDYVGVNDLGTANLLQILIDRPVQRLVIASSMSIYGEGLYRDEAGRFLESSDRSLEQLRRGDWELRDGRGAPLKPVATPEEKRPALASVYALSKYMQEKLCLTVGQAYGMETIALRFFNVYGPRQALSNPYTGVLAIFASRLLNGNRPTIFEDGLQKRDFVHVHDVARACRLALERPGIAGQVFNIGSGSNYTVQEIAEKLADILGKKRLGAEISGRFRVGDIRHCFADIGLARELLGYIPAIRLEDGLLEMAEWLSEQIAVDRFEDARRELVFRGLTA
jgi:dTDP-L-rhamnose 4-epimerase